MTKDEWDVAHKYFANRAWTLSGCDEVSSKQVTCLLSFESDARDRDCANLGRQKIEHEALNSQHCTKLKDLTSRRCRSQD